ncbi:MAG TPA: glycosyltransferase family A protein [Vicinamibacterales bacterium]|jgi:glycosyltransferase involved in cell wall biosynthesis
MSSATPKYVIVSPIRDEEQYIEQTIRGVLQQTILPTEWVIVDDGSRDRTGAIIDGYSTQYPWLKTLHRQDRGQRVPGTGVMEAFYDGYEALATREWDYIVKLDGDVGLPPDYFEECFRRFQDDPRLGMCGGVMYCLQDGVQKVEAQPLLHVRGPIKLYKRACWDELGGLIKAPGWDTVDEIQANHLGWRTRSFPEITVIHYRPTGAAQGAWRDSIKNGRSDYISGYHPLFMAAKCVRILFQRPFLVVGVGQAYGFITGYAKGIPQVQNRALIRYIRRQQMRRLFRLESIWKEERR